MVENLKSVEDLIIKTKYMCDVCLCVRERGNERKA